MPYIPITIIKCGGTPVVDPLHSQYIDYASSWALRGSNPSRGKRFISSPHLVDRLRSLPSFLCDGYRYLSPGVKRSGLDADRSPLYSTDIKNDWCSTSTPPACLYSVYDTHNQYKLHHTISYRGRLWDHANTEMSRLVPQRKDSLFMMYN